MHETLAVTLSFRIFGNDWSHMAVNYVLRPSVWVWRGFCAGPSHSNELTGLWKFDTCMLGIYHRAWQSLFVILPIALLSEIQGAPNIDERFGLLSTECRNLCKLHKHVQKVTKELKNWGSTSGYRVTKGVGTKVHSLWYSWVWWKTDLEKKAFSHSEFFGLLSLKGAAVAIGNQCFVAAAIPQWPLAASRCRSRSRQPCRG